jgi:mono/diheme cytochrome c family protein
VASGPAEEIKLEASHPGVVFRTCPFWGVVLLCAAVLSVDAFAEAAPTPEQIDQGREVYEDNCQTCHGHGMVSPGAATFDLRKFPKDDPARFRGSVLDGKGTAMPAFRGRISDEEVDLLWAYVRGGPFVLACAFFTM